MNIKGFRRMLFGEKMPDKNDPKYKERYEREVEPGDGSPKRHALTWQQPRCRSLPTCTGNLFLVIVFAFLYRRLLVWNIYRITVVYRNQPVQRTATEMQDSVLRERQKSVFLTAGHNKGKSEREQEI